jgi:hypothetical protein
LCILFNKNATLVKLFLKNSEQGIDPLYASKLRPAQVVVTDEKNFSK